MFESAVRSRGIVLRFLTGNQRPLAAARLLINRGRFPAWPAAAARPEQRRSRFEPREAGHEDDSATIFALDHPLKRHDSCQHQRTRDAAVDGGGQNAWPPDARQYCPEAHPEYDEPIERPGQSRKIQTEPEQQKSQRTGQQPSPLRHVVDTQRIRRSLPTDECIG